MDTSNKIEFYQALIVSYLQANQGDHITDEAYHRVIISDRENRHYQLLAMGWITPSRYVDSLLIHVHIKPDGKVWLLENSTDLHVAEDLVTAGILKSDIVLGFHPAEYRALSGYAVA